MSVELKQMRINTALGKVKADLVIKNANIINVFTKEVIRGDIAICNGIIVGIGKYNGNKEIDAEGRFACPGLIDSHVHIESSMVGPKEFAKAILPHGTTTIIADPHEIANVCGVNGIHYILNQTKDLLLNVYIMVPSCVPATPFENNGASLSAEVIQPLVALDRVLGLGEVMDYVSVLNGNNEILKKIELFDHMVIDGHSPSLTEIELNAYRASGILTDHECSTVEEALERLRLGMYVQIREGTAARNLETLVKGLLQKNISFDRCVFCTDDKHLEDIKREGHISFNIKKAISCGLDPINAIQMATINAAECYGLKRLGAIAPGYSADIILLNSIENFSIERVFYRGELANSRQKIHANNLTNNLEVSIADSCSLEDKNVTNTVRIPAISPDTLKLHLKDSLTTIIKILPDTLVTKKDKAKVKVENGVFIADNTYSKLAVIERHKALNKIGLGVVSNFNIKNGAIASTVVHDSHNLIVIGDNDEDMLLAIKEIKRVNGGYTIISNGKVIDTLELPIAGLMSSCSADYVEAKLKEMINKALKLEINKEIDPFVVLSFLALPVIPEIRLTDQGLFDVNEFKFI